MKVFCRGSAYIQKKDLIDLVHMGQADTALLVGVVTCSGYFYCNNEDRFEFVRITDAPVIRWLREQKWLLDYAEVKGMAVDEVIALKQSLMEKRDRLINKYSPIDALQEKDADKIFDQCDYYMLKIHQLTDYTKYLRGEINFKFPDEANPPTNDLRENPKIIVFFNKIRSFFSN